MILLFVVLVWMLAMLLVVGLCAVASRGDRVQEAEAQMLAMRARLDLDLDAITPVDMSSRAASERETTSIAA